MSFPFVSYSVAGDNDVAGMSNQCGCFRCDAELAEGKAAIVFSTQRR
jgi:hypothetical protein